MIFRIVSLIFQIKFFRNISLITGRDRKTVSKWIDRWTVEQSLTRKPGSGYNYALDLDEESELLLAALNSPFDSPVTLRNKLELLCSARTITRCLNQFGIFRRIARNVEFLRRIDLELRYNFARDHRNWTQNQWDRIIWAGIQLKIQLLLF
jgi:hypothetical protein